MHNWEQLSWFQRIIRIIGMALGGMLLAVLIGALFSVVIVFVWNGVMPDLFGLPTIDYLQAFLLIVLSRLLFGGIGHGGHHGHHGPHGFGRHGGRHRGPGKFGFHGHHGFKHHDVDWHQYGEYWNEKGKGDFEEWLKTREKDPEN